MYIQFFYVGLIACFSIFKKEASNCLVKYVAMNLHHKIDNQHNLRLS